MEIKQHATIIITKHQKYFRTIYLEDFVDRVEIHEQLLCEYIQYN